MIFNIKFNSSILYFSKASPFTLFAFLSFTMFTNQSNAQVNVNPSALDSLTSSKEKPTSSTPTKSNRHRQSTTHKAQQDTSINNTKTVIDTPTKKEKKSIPSGVQSLPTVPNAPPPIPVFKDAVLDVPLHPPSLPPMPIVAPKANGSVKTLNHGILLIFDKDSVDLNEAMMKAIIEQAQQLQHNPNGQIYINTYNPIIPDDPSSPRRIAFNRGLAVRAVLMNNKIPSTRIYLMVKGAPPSDPALHKDAESVELIVSSQTAPHDLHHP